MYLSSYQMGTAPEELRTLMRGRTRSVIVANALDIYPDPTERGKRVERQWRDLKSLGLEAEELDLRDYFGDSGALRDRLAAVDLMWVHGGNSFVLKRAFEQSGCEGILRERLEQDTLVYGGFSAALMMVVPTLKGIELCDDPHAVPEGYAPGFSWDGLGLIPYSIAPHFRSEHPETGLIEDVVGFFQAQGMPYRTLHDGEAIVLDGDGDRLVGAPTANEASD